MAAMAGQDPALAPLRTLSPLAGLRRRSLGQFEVTAQSVGTTAPAAAIASVPALVAAEAGNATLYSLLIATVVVVLVAYCINQFARRMAASGSLYTFVARGLGPLPALLCGAGLVVGYGLLAMSTLVLSSTYLLGVLSHVLPHTAGAAPACVVMIYLAGAAACVMTLGVGLSSRVMLALEGAAIGAVVVVTAVVVARSGMPFDARLIRAPNASPDGVAAGVALAITAFIGFESAAALGPETRRPYRSVSRAITRTVAAAAALYAVAGWTQLCAFPGGAAGLAASSTPLPDLATGAGSGWLSGMLDIAIAASSFACAAASATALTRLMFSMARERLLPSALGRTSTRFRTPHVAVLTCWSVIVAVPMAMRSAGVSSQDTFVSLVTVATFGYMLSYVLVCLALPRFLRRIGELTNGPLTAAVTAGAVLVAVLVAYTLPAARPAHRGLLLLSAGLVAVVAIALLLRLRREPVARGRLGVYDESIASDLLDASALRGSAWRRAS